MTTRPSLSLVAGAMFSVAAVALAAQAGLKPPQAEISNGHLKVLVYLPDAVNGFFRGTRFDWAGVIGRLEYQNHVYYQPWFSRMDLAQRDYDATGPEIVAGPNTAVTGPVEEFQRNLGYDEAAAGGGFGWIDHGRASDRSGLHQPGQSRATERGTRRIRHHAAQ